MADQDYLNDHFQREEDRFEIGTCVCNVPVYAGIQLLPKELYLHCDTTGKHFWYDVKLADPIATLGPRKKPGTTKTLLTARVTSWLDFKAQHAAEKQMAELIVVNTPITSPDTSYNSETKNAATADDGSKIGDMEDGAVQLDSSVVDKDNINDKEDTERRRRASPRLAARMGTVTDPAFAMQLSSSMSPGSVPNTDTSPQQDVDPADAERAVVPFNPQGASGVADSQSALVVAKPHRPSTVGEESLLHANFERAMTIRGGTGLEVLRAIEIYVSNHRNHGAFNVLQISKCLLIVLGPLVATSLYSAWRQRNGPGMWSSLLSAIPTFLPDWLRASVDSHAIRRLTQQLESKYVNDMMLDIEAVHGYRMAPIVELPGIDRSLVRAQRALADVLSASKTC